ncbi:MAG: DUF6776 family protein [Pseudomonadota bacterium]
MAESRLVVKTHQPRRARLMKIALAVVVLAGGYGLFSWGQVRGGYNWLDSRQQVEALTAELDALKARNTELREQIALLETTREIDRQAYAEVEASLGSLQAEIQKNREELTFYQGIVSPEEGASGLRIQNLEIERYPGRSLYRLRLVLVQQSRHDRRVTGVVTLSVDGASEGAPVSYTLADLLPEAGGESDMKFSLKFFQDFERDVILPDNFVPDRVTVEINPKGRRAEIVRQSFDWTVSSG